ncbi:PA3496 family putative envelope integrity protein [Psychrobium sp. 1_MG-2023]|uniref:PA3496 family putative envelope integrity protein n=1 Tax=Psychrobium sp. 1_MG-2023 TaxID=3062624 RepID=UPI000C31BF71|nr:hypothetical protein [Psychrobium sp. 1_MG-2023]MDP2560841.1 hypothetical protein [Psychrobium sp. 1_MG-2023]PKF56715.1 hypothetical protein CW748_09560 [Alteromonadales bacterium alter-6D02]
MSNLNYDGEDLEPFLNLDNDASTEKKKATRNAKRREVRQRIDELEAERELRRELSDEWDDI